MPESPPTSASDANIDLLSSALFNADPSRRSAFWKMCQSFCRITTTVMFDLKVFGMENVPKSGGAILASNHQSNLDPVLLGVRLYRPVTYIAKAELFTNPVFGWLIHSLHAFPVRRGTGDVGAIKQALQLLEAGYLLNFFPEGTRSRDGEIGPIQPGIALMVKRAGVPVVPAVIDGAFESMGRGSTFFKPIEIWLQYGPPIDFGRMKGAQIAATLHETLIAMLADLRIRRRAKLDQA